MASWQVAAPSFREADGQSSLRGLVPRRPPLSVVQQFSPGAPRSCTCSADCLSGKARPQSLWWLHWAPHSLWWLHWAPQSLWGLHWALQSLWGLHWAVFASRAAKPEPLALSLSRLALSFPLLSLAGSFPLQHRCFGTHPLRAAPLRPSPAAMLPMLIHVFKASLPSNLEAMASNLIAMPPT